MKYTEARPLIQTGDVVFFRRKTLKDWVIRFVTRGRWGHVGIASRMLAFNEDRVFILEDTLAGRQLSNMSIRADIVAVFRPRNDNDESLEILQDYADNTGRDYSIRNAIIAGFNLPRFFKETEASICSEMVADYLHDIGEMTITKTLLHPQSLYNLCDKHMERIA